MATSIVDSGVLLTIDIGAVNTRAMLFDVVEGQYRLLALGSAPSTAYAPWHDVREGVLQAVAEVERITGRALVTADAQILVPSEDGAGADQLVITLSAGRPLEVVCLGVLAEVSLESARRLAESTYAVVRRTFHLNDRLRLEQRLERIMAVRPDVLILAGGTDEGAERAVEQLLEVVALAAHLAPEGHKPVVLFAGNRTLQPRVEALLSQVAEVTIAPNVRPRLEVEQLDPARQQLLEVFRQVQLREVPGLQELYDLSGGHLYPSAMGVGRVVRHLSRVYDPSKGVLAVDLGASALTLAAAWNGDLALKVYPQWGLGEQLPTLLRQMPVEAVARWVAHEISEDDLLDYLYTKALYPESLPMTQEDLAVEQALARVLLQLAVRRALPDFAWANGTSQRALLPPMEPVLLSGSIFTQAPHPAQAVLMALDGLQPWGVTTLILDQQHLLPVLGAAAEVNPYAAVQAMGSQHFRPLATVVAPLWEGRYGAVVLRAMMEYASGDTMRVELKAGALETLPLPIGQTARLLLQPVGRTDVGAGPGQRLRMRVTGSELGVVLDGRGRPLRLPGDPKRRRELFNRWLWALGG